MGNRTILALPSLPERPRELIVLRSTSRRSVGGPTQPIVPPDTYPNPRNDDAWDNDTVHWLLRQKGGRGWTHGVLFECLREQPNQASKNPQRVRDAASLAKRHGVIQQRVSRGNGSIVRLMRTDPAAPEYPNSEAERRSSA